MNQGIFRTLDGFQRVELPEDIIVSDIHHSRLNGNEFLILVTNHGPYIVKNGIAKPLDGQRPTVR